ncbi:hypothetical protein SCP_0602540 [Sparassis crispa]|uniref:DUF6532 domain-containing protein n=1 Tax=Sparassis crispa TaxID=139825 RepID=A0A401GPY0_9APHY|nr:hypothetical protein SCP_0602540 [Sparassis crispa]GBE84276.1 hypothetical protein SCP_0602540 [Sparassis crispa]
MDPDEVTVTSGSKHRRRPSDDGDAEITHTPKYSKEPDGSQRPCARDFDDFTKEILGLAISIYRCLISTEAPFPDTNTLETQPAQRAWKKACEKTSLNVILTPTLLKMITKCTSHLRGELKTKVRALVGPFYSFRSGENKKIIARNHQHAEELKDRYLFVYQDMQKKTGLYKTELLPMVIGDMWFANKHDEGVHFHEMFNPMPKITIALVLAAIECCIDEWAMGIKENVQFTALSYKPIFNAHLECLERFDKHTVRYKLLGRLCKSLHANARFHSSTEPLSRTTVPVLGREQFDAAIHEDQGSETKSDSDDASDSVTGVH